MPRPRTPPLPSAAHVVTLDLVNQRLAPTSMEPRCSLASYDAETDRLTFRLSSQMPSGARDELCAALGLPTDKIRVVVGDVGGGFGMKTGLYPEDIVVAYAARQVGRPVKWTPARLEEFLSATHGRDVETHAELALDANGKVLAYRVRSLRQCGCLWQHGWDHHPVDDRTMGFDEHLRHPHHRLRFSGGAYAYRADRRLSWRRPARGDLSHRAAVRCRGATSSAWIRPRSGAAT